MARRLEAVVAQVTFGMHTILVFQELVQQRTDFVEASLTMAVLAQWTQLVLVVVLVVLEPSMLPVLV
jgi:hypothetical protein